MATQNRSLSLDDQQMNSLINAQSALRECLGNVCELSLDLLGNAEMSPLVETMSAAIALFPAGSWYQGILYGALADSIPMGDMSPGESFMVESFKAMAGFLSRSPVTI